LPAPDTIHEAVRNALIKDGWTITAEPYVIGFQELRLFADLGAEQPIRAQRADRGIVVEAKSFRSMSPVHDFKFALGQYMLYLAFLEAIAPECKLYLAISEETYSSVFKLKAIQFVVQRYQLALLVVNVETEEVIQWTG
jgi:hypothetical protein